MGRWLGANSNIQFTFPSYMQDNDCRGLHSLVLCYPIAFFINHIAAGGTMSTLPPTAPYSTHLPQLEAPVLL